MKIVFMKIARRYPVDYSTMTTQQVRFRLRKLRLCFILSKLITCGNTLKSKL